MRSLILVRSRRNVTWTIIIACYILSFYNSPKRGIYIYVFSLGAFLWVISSFVTARGAQLTIRKETCVEPRNRATNRVMRIWQPRCGARGGVLISWRQKCGKVKWFFFQTPILGWFLIDHLGVYSLTDIILLVTFPRILPSCSSMNATVSETSVHIAIHNRVPRHGCDC